MDDQNKTNQDQEEVKTEDTTPADSAQDDAATTPSAPTTEEESEAQSEDVEEKIEPIEKTEEASEPEEVPSLVESQEQHDERMKEEAEAKGEVGQEAQATSKIEKGDPNDPSKWYIVHTYSGHENKVAKSINQRVQSLGFENRIFDVIVPTRNTIKVSGGKKETVKEKIFPGYVLVKMVLDDESWLLLRTTQGVTAFIGAGNKPTPISEKEVEAIQKFMNAEEPLYKASFSVGEAVKIVDGPFSDFLGTIDNIDEARGKLKVLVSIFGRETPVELDFLQVNKL
jgi:transcriptional antiterminator NusG